MKNHGASAIIVVAIAAFFFAAISNCAAGDSDLTNPSNAAQPAPSGTLDPGQVLEIAPTYNSSQAAPPADSGSAGDSSSADTASSGDASSDGTHTYARKDQNADTGGGTQDNNLPNPSYGSVDEYMNQQAQAEAMGPAFSPFFGSSMPMLVDPFFFYGGYPLLPPPVISPPPAPSWRPPRSGWGGGFHPHLGGGFHPHHR
jgi:hypothetical protein